MDIIIKDLEEQIIKLQEIIIDLKTIDNTNKYDNEVEIIKKYYKISDITNRYNKIYHNMENKLDELFKKQIKQCHNNCWFFLNNIIKTIPSINIKHLINSLEWDMSIYHMKYKKIYYNNFDN